MVFDTLLRIVSSSVGGDEPRPYAGGCIRSVALGALVLVAALAVACGEDSVEPTGPSSGAGASSQGGAGQGGSGAAAGGGEPACHAEPKPADAERYVVIAHPYDAMSNQASDYEVLALDSAGSLTRTATTFAMGRANQGVIAFTPDGAVGIAVHADGSLGSFVIDATGNVQVVQASFTGAFYAGWVVMGEDGRYAWVLDPNFQNNGGGIYRIGIGCDGTLSDEGLVTASKLAQRMVRLDDGSFVLAADEVLGAPLGSEVQLLSLLPQPSLQGSVDAFADDEAIIASLARSRDGAYALVGDNSGFSSVPNRVAVLSLATTPPNLVQTLSPLEDPASILVSPFDDRALVVSGFGDAIFELGYDPSNASAPFAVIDEVTYQGGSPQLPVDAVMVERGMLSGHVLVAEVGGVRQLDFRAGMPIADRGLFDLGGGTENIVGAIGVQP